MSRRTAAIVGLGAWLLALLAAPEKTLLGVVIWGAVAGTVIGLSIVTTRVIARELRRAVLKDRP